MKAILMSIKPEWVKKILNGEKTIEIRKTKPKCDLPIKVYIYCTKGQELWGDGTVNTWYGIDEGEDMERVFELTPTLARLNGKVVAEFTLNKIIKHEKNYIDIEDELCYNFLIEDLENSGFIEAHTDLGILNALLDFTSFTNNYGNGKQLYAWHIDDLIIYDTPKELSEFSSILKRMKGKESRFTSHLLQRPPQSWQYIKGE